MNSLYEARNSIYCYPNSNVLVNKLNIMNNSDLLKYENKMVLVKLYDLRQQGITGEFDINHFVSIHKYLFDEIYPFAGLFRNENIAKDNFRFAEWEFIEPELRKILNELKGENFLKGLTKETFSERLAYYMAELNVLHPFREGNGRATREFIRQLALYNGYYFNLAKIDPKEMLNASIESVVHTEKLRSLIEKALDKIESK
ncbi:MAG TPA: Fic family protein [Candidatus Merdicola faecigallinarum]|uniref:protein adenylyltransferase n=1 Tax=Candidatus Merdicola faecigallinarum TaxID=2840862 RepID=A0A9D1M1Y4_9FIRM|nr:Fic family protein [Candidatus Merdicola faecigallinarum]